MSVNRLKRDIFVLFFVSFVFGWALALFCKAMPPDTPVKAEVVDYGWFLKLAIEEPRREGTSHDNKEQNCRQDDHNCDRDTAVPLTSLWSLDSTGNLSRRFVYQVKILNFGSDVITDVAWDYLFLDPSTNEDLGRHEFFTACRIGPGETKTLSMTSLVPPTWTVSVDRLKLGKREFSEKVLLRSITYRGKSAIGN